MVNPESATAPFQVNELTAAAKDWGQKIIVVNVGPGSDMNAAFETIAKRGW